MKTFDQFIIEAKSISEVIIRPSSVPEKEIDRAKKMARIGKTIIVILPEKDGPPMYFNDRQYNRISAALKTYPGAKAYKVTDAMSQGLI